jgi:N-acetylneuraminate lyase
LIDTLGRHGGVLPAGKALMGMLGVACGPCRAPLASLDAASASALRADLNAIGFFSWDVAGAV